MSDRFQIEVKHAPSVPDQAFWAAVPGHAFSYSLDVGGMPVEAAEVRFAWNGQGLYVHAELEDSYVVAVNRRDEQFHFKTGDVFELFVKPLHDDYYWEMYATPFGNSSTLFFPREREGMTVNDFLTNHSQHGLDVSAEKTPTGWVAELFVPAAQLSAPGQPWGPSGEWTVLCGRYNYNNDELENPELSMFPPVSATNYHLTAEYAVLNFNADRSAE